ncbi:hypothetical protein GE061_016293 [Apolygus lucorum]|uniref:Spaetzle domain-containing protein n=1 Tax=Apolygus lucorum TaxID=248454 RepID=A0A8S9XH09_APOLU|nr:hypothetical protein GE061_016293 [Apolygus lucorum]
MVHCLKQQPEQVPSNWSRSVNPSVVSLAACIEGWQRGTRSMNSNETLIDSYEEESSERYPMRLPKQREFLLNKEMDGMPVECCPSIKEMTEPLGGKDEKGDIVELYSGDHITKQRFHELSCRPDVVDKPCNFLEKPLQNQSKCSQKYSFSYAIIKKNHEQLRHEHHGNSPSSGSNWYLGYIRVRSGCACEVTHRSKRKRSSHRKNRKGNHGGNHHKKAYGDTFKKAYEDPLKT